MNDALSYSLNAVKHEIPDEILEMAFTPTYRHGNGGIYTIHTSVDTYARIKSEIIDGRVRQDIGLLGASQFAIPLAMCEIVGVTDYEYTVYAPPSVTGGRTITQFLGVYTLPFDYGNMSMSPWPSNDQLATGARDIFKSHEMIPTIMSENGHIVGPNRISIIDYSALRPTGTMRVNMDSDEGMSHISPGNYPRIAELVVLATKAYIYKTVRVKLNRGAIEQGYDVGVISDIVDEYRDANEEYKEYLENVWHRAGSFDNNQSRLRRHRKLIGRY